MRVTHPLSQQEREKAAVEIMERRFCLYRRVVDYIERNNGSSVIEQLSRLARLNSAGDHRLSSAVISHLTTLFAGRIETNDRADSFVELVSPILDNAGDDAIPTEAPVDAVPAQGWAHWLANYRQCLDVLREPFGLPGHIFRAASRTEMNQTLISA
jgi:hypothetical protein